MAELDAMTGMARGIRGGTLRPKGAPAYFVRLLRSLKLDAAIYILIGCAVGVVSVPIALWGMAETGVVAKNQGGPVAAVLPGSSPWYDGIRPDQLVVEIRTADAPTGWQIVTAVDGRTFTSNASIGLDRLRGTLPGAALAAICAVAALLAFGRRRRWTEGWAALALGLGAIPAIAVGDRIGADLATAFAIIGPSVWVVRWQFRVRLARSALVLGSIAVSAAWIATREVAPAGFDVADAIATGTRFALLVLVVAALTVPSLADPLRRLGGFRTLDVTAAVGGVVILAVLAFLAPGLLPIGIGLGLVALVLYPRGRARLGVVVDHLLIADLRERTSLEATEQERARLAHDLHDVPLQELSGVIRRMELRPELHSETAPLRQIADELRAMATALRPPVLEDLGLGPALETLATQDAAARPLVQSTIVNHAGYRPAERAPSAVEVAIFRAAQEAVRNAVAHSNGGSIVVSGAVGSSRIAINVDDDGVGIAEDSVTSALRRGRLGLPSMRRRMASIGGTIELARVEPHGLSVRLRWDA